MQLFKNIFSMVSLKGLEYILALVLLPFLVRVLGAEKYGAIILMQNIMQYFIICTDYGFSMIAPRKIAVSENRHEHALIFSSTLICKFILAFVCTCIFGCLYLLGFLDSVIDIKLFIAVYLNVIGNVLFPIWYFQGIEKMGYITIFNIIARTITVIIIFSIVKGPDDYIWAATWQSMGMVISGLISLVFLFCKYSYLFIVPSCSAIKNNFIDGWDIFISNIAINAYTATNVIILRFFTSDIIVGYYGAANKIIESIKGLLNPVSLAVYPYVSKKLQVNLSEGVLFLHKVLKYYFIFGLLVFITIEIFADYIVLLLLGNQYGESIELLRIMGIVPLFVAVSNVFGTHTLLALGYTKTYGKILISCACISVVMIIPLSKFLLGSGAAITMAITEFLVALFMYIVLRKSKIVIWKRGLL